MQDRGEPIRAFAAHLRGQTEVCRFTKKCTCDRVSNQGEERVADQLCIGLADAEIQVDLLKHPDQDMGVEETIRFIEIRAAGKRSVVTMFTPTSTNGLDEDEGGEAISSTYRRQQRRPSPAKPTPSRPRIRPPNQALPRGNNHPTPRNSSTRGTGPPQPGTRSTPNKRSVCQYCGLPGHGEQERTAHRRIHCPAFGTTCSSCGRANHNAVMCLADD